MSNIIPPENEAKIRGMAADDIEAVLNVLRSILFTRELAAKGFVNDGNPDLVPIIENCNNMLKDTLLIF